MTDISFDREAVGVFEKAQWTDARTWHKSVRQWASLEYMEWRLISQRETMLALQRYVQLWITFVTI